MQRGQRLTGQLGRLLASHCSAQPAACSLGAAARACGSLQAGSGVTAGGSMSADPASRPADARPGASAGSAAAGLRCTARLMQPAASSQAPWQRPGWGLGSTSSGRLPGAWPPSSSAASPAAWGSMLQPLRGYAHRYNRQKRKQERRLNNRASWMAARPFMEDLQPGMPGYKPPRGPQAPVIDTALPALPEVAEPDHVTRIGRITGPYRPQLQAAFAVFQLGPKQYKVTADDLIWHPKLAGLDVQDVVQLGKVLMWGTADATAIGRPYLPGVTVIAAVEEVAKDAKVHVFRKKARKRYQKHSGPRPQHTALRILEIQEGGAPLAAASRITWPDKATLASGGGGGGSPEAAGEVAQPEQQQPEREQRHQHAPQPRAEQAAPASTAAAGAGAA